MFYEGQFGAIRFWLSFHVAIFDKAQATPQPDFLFLLPVFFRRLE